MRSLEQSLKRMLQRRPASAAPAASRAMGCRQGLQTLCRVWSQGQGMWMETKGIMRACQETMATWQTCGMRQSVAACES